MRLGSFQVGGRAALAPTAGITDTSFRQLCVDFGAGYVVAEMMSAQDLTYKSYKTNQLMKLSDTERPTAIQLFGDEPDCLARGAGIAMNFSPDAIDIDAGYPASKVCGASGRGHDSGSALVRGPELYGKVVAAVKTAVDVSVTVKTCKGWDKSNVNAVEVAQIREAAGADAVVIRGRTREQMYQSNADWETITAVKQVIEVPVVGDGDVTDAKSVAKMLGQTGCDMVMAGRAAPGNSWIFREIHTHLTTGVFLPSLILSGRLLVTLRHVRVMCEDEGENRAMREAHKHAGWYFKGLLSVTSFRREVGQLTAFRDIELLAQRIFSSTAGGASHGTVIWQKPPATDFPAVEGSLL